MTSPSPSTNAGGYDLNQLIQTLRGLMTSPDVGGVSDQLAQALLQTGSQQNIAALQQAINLATQTQANNLRQTELMGADEGGATTDAAARWRAELQAQQDVQGERLRQQYAQLLGYDPTTGTSTLEGQTAFANQQNQAEQTQQRWAELMGQSQYGAPTLAAQAQQAEIARQQAQLLGHTASGEQTMDAQRLAQEAQQAEAERQLRLQLQSGQLGQQEAEFARNYLLQQGAQSGYTAGGGLTEEARRNRAQEQNQRAATAADLMKSSRDVFRAGRYFREMRNDPTGTGLGTGAGVSGFTTAANRNQGTPGTVNYDDIDAAISGVVANPPPGQTLTGVQGGAQGGDQMALLQQMLGGTPALPGQAPPPPGQAAPQGVPDLQSLLAAAPTAANGAPPPLTATGGGNTGVVGPTGAAGGTGGDSYQAMAGQAMGTEQVGAPTPVSTKTGSGNTGVVGGADVWSRSQGSDDDAPGTQPGGPVGMGAGGRFVGRGDPARREARRKQLEDPRVQKFFKQLQASHRAERAGTGPGGPQGRAAKTFSGEQARNERYVRGLHRLHAKGRLVPGTQPGGSVDAPLWPTGSGGSSPMPTLQSPQSLGGQAAVPTLRPTGPAGGYDDGLGGTGPISAADTAGQDQKLAAFEEYLRRYGVQGMGAQELERMNGTERGVLEGAFEALGLNPDDAKEAYAQTRFSNTGNALSA